MIAGQSMTEAMLGSGFNTKSNFNREFLRVTNHSPTDWTKTRLSVCGGCAPLSFGLRAAVM